MNMINNIQFGSRYEPDLPKQPWQERHVITEPIASQIRVKRQRTLMSGAPHSSLNVMPIAIVADPLEAHSTKTPTPIRPECSPALQWLEAIPTHE